MKKNVLFIALMILVITGNIFAENEKKSEEKKDSPKNIILIGWDGAQRNHVKECLGKNELPNLKKLSDEGALVAIDIMRITDTKAGWSQILSGYNPEISGVFSNGDYQPIPAGYTVFERLEKHFGKDNIYTAALIGKKGHVDNDAPQKINLADENKKGKNKKQGKKNNKNADKNQKLNSADESAEQKTAENKEISDKDKTETNNGPELITQDGKKPEGKIVTENGVKFREIPGKPYFNTQNNMDIFLNGLKEDTVVGAKAVELIEKNKDKRFFFFVHFAEVDHKGHTFGENSKEYNDALISGDTQLGKIVEKLKELKLYDNTIIYVTADHGFDEGKKSHRDAPYVFLATNDKQVMRRGERADITPTILSRFGLDLSKIEPALSGKPLTSEFKQDKW